MSFPIAPVNGEQATVNGIRYYYSTPYSAWIRVTSAKFTASATGPSNPALGDHWYDTNLDILFEFISDGTSSYWVDISSQTIAANVSGAAATTTTTTTVTESIHPFLLAGM